MGEKSTNKKPRTEADNAELDADLEMVGDMIKGLDPLSRDDRIRVLQTIDTWFGLGLCNVG